MPLPLSLAEMLSIHQELLAVFPALTLDGYDLESSDLWCSKLGSVWDIYHRAPEILHGEQYGHVVQVMKRPIP
jgi:hypothetical protein